MKDLNFSRMHLYNKCTRLQRTFSNGFDNSFSTEFDSIFNAEEITSNNYYKKQNTSPKYTNTVMKNVLTSNFIECEDNRKQDFTSSSKSISFNSSEDSVFSTDNYKQHVIEHQKTGKSTLYYKNIDELTSKSCSTYNQSYQHRNLQNKLCLPNYSYGHSSHSNPGENFNEVFRSNSYGYDVNQINTNVSAEYHSLTHENFVPQYIISEIPNNFKEKKQNLTKVSSFLVKYYEKSLMLF